MAVKETTQLLFGGSAKRTLLNSQFFAHELIHVSQMMKNPSIARGLPPRLLHEPIQLLTAHGEIFWPLAGGIGFGFYGYIFDWDL